MSKNIKTISVRFNRLYNNPTFIGLFNRFDLKVNEWIEMKVNHKHFSDIERMATTFE
jgi:hypothetical protein